MPCIPCRNMYLSCQSRLRLCLNPEGHPSKSGAKVVTYHRNPYSEVRTSKLSLSVEIPALSSKVELLVRFTLSHFRSRPNSSSPLRFLLRRSAAA